ncbi:hypothetical protein [Massilicoli timonensis]|uniref:Zinc ribbon domain-containing protein n=1 Tax=Massilicoli timonensis TaxID=2015901 RepID=A0ABT1SN53_9FIRM|nr:hypothetical protein [Massilicoli timonensis]MCQ5122125.1 hypothetical protein [Massilicoli timonensis]
MIAAVILILLLIGITVWIVWRKRSTHKVDLSKINGEVYDEVCAYCGSMMKANDRYCPNCLKERK